MPRTYAKIEYFQFIEAKGSVTVEEFAKKFGLDKKYAGHWLSKWAGRGYLKWAKGSYVKRRGHPSGCYMLGEKWWGELVHGSEVEFM